MTTPRKEARNPGRAAYRMTIFLPIAHSLRRVSAEQRIG